MRLTIIISLLCLAGSSGLADPVQGQRASINGTVSVLRKGNVASASGDVAIWLTPVAVDSRKGSSDRAVPRPHFKMVQHEKRFEPHFLVVPVNSVVEFPNVDPVFHNVFSMFNGKRFDLGLYEAGTSRSVAFGSAGVCYVFCNIHPEMSAVVLVVETPYYAVSNPAGEFTVPNLPPGQYLLHVWHESHKLERPDDFPRQVTIADSTLQVGTIRLIASEVTMAQHKNKYGRDYDPPQPTSPVYK